jgi:hypothetical protein
MTATIPTGRSLIYTSLIYVSVGVICPLQALASPQAQVTYGAGEKLWLRLDHTVSSRTAQVGDRLEAELRRPKTATVTRVTGSVAAARAADKAHRISSRLILVFRQVVLTDGRAVPIESSIEMDGSAMQTYSFGWTFLAACGMAALGGVIGGRVSGGSGAAVGVPIGSVLGWVPLTLASNRKWRDVSIKKGRSFPVDLKREVNLPLVASPKP